MSLTCLTGLVGLAQRDCNCVSGGQPSGYNSSESGYYLDDREYGFPLKEALDANLDCGEGNIWSLLSEARTNAIRDVKSDLVQTLTTAREDRVINWRGLVGKTETTGGLITGAAKVGVQLRPKFRLKDAYFVAKALHININATKSVTVGIASNDGTFTAVSGSASVTANQWSKYTFPTAVSLPLYSIATQDLRYHVYYEPDGAKSRQNRLWCCSPPGWKQHLEAGAFSSASLPIDSELPTSQDAYGLAIEGYFTCNKLDWICDLEEMNGYDLRDFIARLIMYKGAIHAIHSVLESGKVNKYTLMKTEHLLGRRNKLMKLYSEGMLWVAQELPSGVTSCWGCERNAPQVNSLIS